ncbi:Histidine ammonia-lyase, partial [Bienertia sinuspersici]
TQKENKTNPKPHHFLSVPQPSPRPSTCALPLLAGRQPPRPPATTNATPSLSKFCRVIKKLRRKEVKCSKTREVHHQGHLKVPDLLNPSVFN